MVGTDLGALGRVVESGNLRKRLTLLFCGIASKDSSVFTELGLGSFPRSPEIEAERPYRRESTYLTDQLADFKREVNARTDLSNADKVSLIARETKKLLRTDDDPSMVYPPLSQDERNFVVDQDGRLRWRPAKNFLSVTLSSPLHQRAEVTGGLVMTGTSSGGSFVFIQLAKQMQRQWGVPVDLGLLRLALLAWEIPPRNHTFHELMRGSELGDSTLTYRDRWDRYRHLAPLTEQELRERVAPDGKFPEEHAWAEVPLRLNEREPPAAQFDHLPTVDQPAYLLLDAEDGKDPTQVVNDRLEDSAVLMASLTAPNPAPGQLVVVFTAGLGKDASTLPGAGPGQVVVPGKGLKIDLSRVQADNASGRSMAWVTVSSQVQIQAPATAPSDFVSIDVLWYMVEVLARDDGGRVVFVRDLLADDETA